MQGRVACLLNLVNKIWLMMRDRTNTFNLIFPYIAILFVLWFQNLAFAIGSATAVDPQIGEVVIDGELEIMVKYEAVKLTVVQNDDCNTNYVGRVSQEAGKIRLISSTQENGYVVIPDDDDTQRFLPKNLPDIFKKDGLKIIFSGKICEIPENVRLMGTPLILIEIEKVKTNDPGN